MIQNSHVRELLSQTEQGKILLELENNSPVTLDDLSERVGVATVIVKNAINAMADMRIVRFDPSTREVHLMLE